MCTIVAHSETNGDRYRVQVLERACNILDLLAASGPELSLAELSEKLKLHKSTVHRLVTVLERHRMLDKSASNGKYRLGLKLFELGAKAASCLDVRDRARPFLERLAFETGETVHLCVLDRGEALYLDKVEPERSVRLASSVGRRVPVHCTSVGKAILAHLPEEEVNDIIRQRGMAARTRHTITTPAQLKAELSTIRQRGYAVDNEENEEGVRCLGAPIRDYTGAVVAAISISGPTFRVTTEQVVSLACVVVASANEVSRELGAKPESLSEAVTANY